MTRPTPRISTRKEPKQARSNELVAAILDAAVQVLTKEGAQRFTTARVAEKAGVSVGSLYQYFPNKAAILFRLQSDEWERTISLMRGILDDRARTPLDRLRALAHTFILSECEEADMRTALDDAAPLYRDAPEAIEAIADGFSIFRSFASEALPTAPATTQSLAADLIAMTLTQVGQAYSEKARSPEEIEVFAGVMADMLCAYLETLAG